MFYLVLQFSKYYSSIILGTKPRSLSYAPWWRATIHSKKGIGIEYGCRTKNEYDDETWFCGRQK